ncbi:DUF2272 domain-containing protein [Roseomonas elaeocarpi]|uniref:DUF2272 domain-containing protein n=1 Tax=Roseomonas elaeocarpi TaxID=907779 RepID=A0ABV6JWY6_9PROT
MPVRSPRVPSCSAESRHFPPPAAPPSGVRDALRTARPLARWCRAAALILPLAVAACAGGPPAATTATRAYREAPLPYPPSAKQRIVRFAEEEWQEWGGITVLSGEKRPPSHAPGPESSLSNFPRVLAYWRAVDGDSAIIDRNRDRYAAALAGAATTPWSEPAWSAAFISWVMRSAGVGYREFPGNAAHAFYLDALLTDAQDFPATAPFVPHDPASYVPVPGDLVCGDRSRRPLLSWQQRMGEIGQFRPTHCDIVVRASATEVDVVGGNVADAVTMTRLLADGTGRLLPRPPGEPTTFAVMEDRLGSLPPFATTAAPLSLGVPGS